MGRGQQLTYSPAELSWIEANAQLTRREAHTQFCELFARDDVNLNNFKALCTRNGWTTGRTGCFPKGHVSANKGKKMPYNANSARTQFKKGGRTGIARKNYKPVGFERVTVDGYVERKVNDALPFNKRWRQVHVLNWEAVHGPMPKGHFLKCLNGDRANTDASNWACLPRGAQPYLNGGYAAHGLNYEQASPEVKTSIIALAKLKYATSEKSRAKRKACE